MKKPVIIGVLFVVAVLVALVYSTMSMAAHKVEVCMEFNGRTQCRAASGSSEAFAMRSAVSNACAMIAGGVTDTIACESSTPKRVTWIKR